jgi:hypothetical protein
MAIKLATAPQESLNALRSKVETWQAQPASAPAAAHIGLNFAADAGVDVRLPHPVYDVALSELAAGKGLANAHVTSWRYLLNDGEMTAMAEVTAAKDAKPHTLSMLNRGPFIPSLVQAVDTAEKDATLAGNYEVATINIPGLYVVALWLRAQPPGQGVVIPLDPAPPQLKAGQKYTEAQFAEALAPAAKQVLEASGPALTT